MSIVSKAGRSWKVITMQRSIHNKVKRLSSWWASLELSSSKCSLACSKISMSWSSSLIEIYKRRPKRFKRTTWIWLGIVLLCQCIVTVPNNRWIGAMLPDKATSSQPVHMESYLQSWALGIRLWYRTRNKAKFRTISNMRKYLISNNQCKPLTLKQ